MAVQDTSDIRSIKAAVKVHSVFQQATGIDAEGKAVLEWFVDYSPVTDPPNLGRITRKWSELEPDERARDPHSAIGQMARTRYEVMLPYVEAAQRGQEVVVQGTPFAMWAGLDQRRADVLRQFGLRTVEELVEAPESMLIRLSNAMPDVRYYRALAGRFLDASEQSKASAAISQRDATIDELKSANDGMRSEVEELRAMLNELLSKQQAAAEAAAKQTEQRGGRRQNEAA